jgi:hypothetical protein
VTALDLAARDTTDYPYPYPSEVMLRCTPVHAALQRPFTVTRTMLANGYRDGMTEREMTDREMCDYVADAVERAQRPGATFSDTPPPGWNREVPRQDELDLIRWGGEAP